MVLRGWRYVVVTIVCLEVVRGKVKCYLPTEGTEDEKDMK